MCDPVTIALVATTVATVGQGYAAKQQGKFEQGVQNYNARQLENEAIRTRNVGTEQELEQREKTAQLIGAQRAQIGAAGLSLASGSPAALLEDSAYQGEVDALRIRSNFQQQAQSLDDQSSLARAQGAAARQAGNNAFTGSLLQAGAGVFGSDVASKWFTPSSAAASTAASGVSASTLNSALPNTFSRSGGLRLY